MIIKPDVRIEIDPQKLAGYVRNLKTTLSRSVRVGYNDESGKYNNGRNVAEVARINEFGYGNHPPQPFMKPAFEDNKFKYVDYLKETTSKFNPQNIKKDIDDMLLTLGNEAKEDIQYYIDMKKIKDPRPTDNTDDIIDSQKMKDELKVWLVEDK